MPAWPYHVKSDDWERIQKALPYFKEKFVLKDSGLDYNDPRIEKLDKKIYSILGFENGAEHRISSLPKICYAAQYARGLMVAEKQPDGTFILFGVTKH